MNIIDALLVLTVALTMWAGWAKGFVSGIAGLAIWIGSLMAGFFFYQETGNLLQKAFPLLRVWSMPLAFLLNVFLARLLLSFALNCFIRHIPQETHLSMPNHLLGLLPGAVTGGIYATILAALLLNAPFSNEMLNKARESRIANKLGIQVAWLDEKFSPIFGEAAKETAKRIVVKPESGETVDLHYTVKTTRARPDLEAQMFVLVNEERTKRGLKPVVYDAALTPVARAHSTDMFARGYFSHYTPEKKDPFDRMDKAGVKFKTAGENLALGRTLKICHEGLMNSPGHKANILNPAFGRLGIGIMDGGIYGLMISQEFRN